MTPHKVIVCPHCGSELSAGGARRHCKCCWWVICKACSAMVSPSGNHAHPDHDETVVYGDLCRQR